MTQKKTRGCLKLNNYACCALSAGLLILSFPKTDFWICAWGGLVPLMHVLDGKKPSEAFRWAYLCGLIFFTGTFFWFFHLTQWFSTIAALGIIGLLGYLSVYFGLFGLSYSLFSRQKPLLKLFLLPSIWVVLEFIRAHLFTGFDWASLGHSQYKNLPIIQIADLTGVFGISFLIVMVNSFLKECLTAAWMDQTSRSRKNLSLLTRTTAFTVVCVLGYGIFRLLPWTNQNRPGRDYSIAVIQANTPQERKWQKSAWPAIREQYFGLTEQAALHNPELIIWPETSYPGYLWEDQEAFIELRNFVRHIKIPLLFGSVLHEGKDYYNAALLLSKDGEIAGTYRKIHLVPFGEYFPLRPFAPFLANLLAIGDFTPGHQWTTFTAVSPGAKGRQDDRSFDSRHRLRPWARSGFRPEGEKQTDTTGYAQGAPFSALICFEDTVAWLSRQFTRRGSQLLINMTNDAWFEDSKAPFMHLQSSVFRAVENRRGLVRAANTGVSCFIDRWGRIVRYLEGKKGNRNKKTYISGYAIANVNFNAEISFYTKFGDVFTFLCFGCILMGIIKNIRCRN